MDCRSTHTSVCRPRPLRRCRFCTRVGFSLDYPLPSRFARRGARTASLGTRATLAAANVPSLSGRVLETVGSGVQRVRVHTSRGAATRSIPRWRSPWAAVTRAEIRDDVGRGAIPPPSRDPPVVWESAGDRRRARDSSRRRRHATADHLRPAPNATEGFAFARSATNERSRWRSPLPSLTPRRRPSLPFSQPENKEEHEFQTGPLSVLTQSVKTNSQVLINCRNNRKTSGSGRRLTATATWCSRT